MFQDSQTLNFFLVTDVDTPILSVEEPGSEGYVIGRSDDTSTYIPDIDLMAWDARRLGVSRRHAVLVRYQGQVHVVDLNSVNGTFINKRRIPADIPIPFKSGDRLSLGKMVLIMQSKNDS
ncbi:hypothetical protein MASR2M15_06090 [Anaerolineales bacterium]